MYMTYKQYLQGIFAQDRTIILSVVLYGCEILFLILREVQRLRMFENRVLGTIFGSKTDKVTGGWRKMHNEELHKLNSLSNIIRMTKLRRMGWVGHVAGVEKKENACRILVGKPEGKRPLGRPRSR
jgi:hypothetical protein